MYKPASVQTAPRPALRVISRPQTWHGRAVEAYRQAEREEVAALQAEMVSRIAAGVIGLISIALAIPAQKLNIAFLVALAFAVAASANLPSIVYNAFWRRFNTRGAVWSIYGGLISSLGLVLFSPVVSGKVAEDPVTGAQITASLLPLGVDFSWFPLENPGIVSIPLGFFFGWLGSVTSREPSAEDRFTELEVRGLTGAGAEAASQH